MCCNICNMLQCVAYEVLTCAIYVLQCVAVCCLWDATHLMQCVAWYWECCTSNTLMLSKQKSRCCRHRSTDTYTWIICSAHAQHQNRVCSFKRALHHCKRALYHCQTPWGTRGRGVVRQRVLVQKSPIPQKSPTPPQKSPVICRRALYLLYLSMYIDGVRWRDVQRCDDECALHVNAFSYYHRREFYIGQRVRSSWNLLMQRYIFIIYT